MPADGQKLKSKDDFLEKDLSGVECDRYGRAHVLLDVWRETLAIYWIRCQIAMRERAGTLKASRLCQASCGH